MTPERRDYLKSIGWEPRVGCPCENCTDFASTPVELRADELGPKALQTDRTNPKDLLGLLKLPLRLFPPAALAFGAKVFALGAKKYGPFNWRSNAVKRTVYLEAAMRHILSALDGEDLDPESGEPHEAHALACMAIILDAKATGNLIDDRFTPGVFGKLVQEMQEKKESVPNPPFNPTGFS